MPPGVRNGNHNGQGKPFFTTGMSVTYTCDPGHYLVGNAAVFCRVSGNWSQPGPRCEVTVCINPDVENGRQIDGHQIISAPGQMLTFQCHDGYSLQGSAKIFCQEDGSWQPPAPVCNRLYHSQELSNRPDLPGACGAPTRLRFAELNEEHKNEIDFSVGKTVQYTCLPGYTKHPGMSPTITCLESGVWSEALEFCKRKQCNHPGEPVNGKIIFLTDLLFGSTVVYGCEEGHRLIGQSSRRCEVSGGHVAWSGDIPICQRIPCEPPPDIPNGKHTGRLLDEFHFGTSIKYTCNPGYPLRGEPSIHCTTRDGKNGVWSGPPPQCGASQCSRPPAIANGKHSGPATAVFPSGASVSYACDPGYVLVGEAQLNCTSSGAWSLPAPRCEASQCSRPPAIANGKHSGPATAVFPSGASVSYACDPGYVLVGEAQLNCTSSGAWSLPAPRCEGRLCPTPPAIEHGQHDGRDATGFSPGKSVNYSCDPSYALVGKTTLYCTVNGTWSIPYPRCEEVQCPSPPDIEKGNHNSQDLDVFTTGMVVNYSCDPGYRLLGEASIYCTDSGNWSLPPPQCAGGCGAPPNFTFAELTEEYRNVMEFPVGDTVQYSCQPGYMRHPGVPSTLTCLQNHTWSEALAFCERKQCKYPETPKNGRVVVLTNLLFKSVVSHTCEEGYQLVGQSHRRCEISGPDVAWSGALPICQKVVCPVPQIQNGTVSVLKYHYTYKDTVSFKCYKGFSLRGHHTAQCQADNTWDPPLPVCEQDGMAEHYRRPETTTKPAVKCLRPPSIANGEHSSHFSDTFDVGALVHYRCKQGFSLIGNESVRCTTHGVWSHPLPQCKELHCSKPAGIVHGSLSSPAKAFFTPGTYVRYICEPGFSLLGTASIYCTESGAWSHPSPVCKVVKCPHPPNITNGKLKGNISNAFSYGASVSYSCNPGYSLVGNAFINCTASGTWSQPPPQCKEIRCVFPEVQGVKKAIKGNTYRSGTNITLECDDGYTLEGISQVQCQEDFSWDPPVPACKLMSRKPSSVGLGVAAAGVLLLLGAGVVWKIISKQKEGYYNTYENYSYQTPLNQTTEQKCSCSP
ncbi:complement receptor type 2 [Egretta garzetta]|nr:complement receptor type 2 [Egretta garzetta]